MQISNKRLVELRELIGLAKFKAFASRASEDLTARMTQIASGQLSADQISHEAHKLVAIAGALGLTELTDACARLSQSARAEKDVGALSAAIDETLVLGNEALRFLDAARDQ